MEQFIGHITLVVRNYDEALAFYLEKLNFLLVEDTLLEEGKRWVLIRPPGASSSCLLLAQASNEKQTQVIGNQTGGRVGFFLFTDDFWRDYKAMKEKGISFVRPPAAFDYGQVAVFEDLYGNLWDLIQASNKHIYTSIKPINL